jgi:UPF0755 protein
MFNQYGKNIISSVLTLLIILLLAFSVISYRFLNTAIIPANKSFYYILQPGGSVIELIQQLTQQGYLKHPKYLIFYAKMTGKIHNLKAGEYEFAAGTTPYQLIRKLELGLVIQHEFRIIEGWSIRQLLIKLNNANALKHELIENTPEQLTKIFMPEQNNMEGWFFPATYYYFYGDTDKQILTKAFLTMQKKLQTEWENRAANLPYQNAYQALIVASLIEKETSIANEKPMIASVILNRLAKNMPLQIDPTVIYGLGAKYVGMITKKDLQSDSQYNTYKNKGLPPTPIALPGLTSIHAALHPANSNAIYYVATGHGGHNFSVTWDEHQIAVKQYRQQLAKNIKQKMLPVAPRFPCYLLPTEFGFICK